MNYLMVLFSLLAVRTTCFISTFSSNIVQRRLFSSAVNNVIPSGVCAVYKPKDWSSNDVVQKIRLMMEAEHRKRTSQKIRLKVGHGGTLDPIAEGVLVIGVGEGTKFMADYLNGSKGYLAKGCFGAEYDTLDRTGQVIATKPYEHITLKDINNILPEFTGDIMQVPPMFSALKRDGKVLYDLARKGIEVEREPRPVKVYKLGLSDNPSLSLPHFELEVECGGGFYIRSLISDLAQKLNSAAYMAELVRTKVGIFTVNECLQQQNWNYGSFCDHIFKCSKIVNLDPLSLPSASASTVSTKPNTYYSRR